MQNKLPLARDRNAQEPMAAKDALLKCFAIATTPESADYLVEKFKNKLIKAGLFESSQPVFARFVEHAENVRAQTGDRANPYLPGEEILSDFQNFQRNLCKNALNVLMKELTSEVKIDFAVSDGSEMVRSFSANGKPLEPKAASAMDKVLNSVLANENMISKNSVIYESTDGKIREVAGKPVKADKEKIAKTISEDLSIVLHKNDLEVNSQRHKFPEQAPAVVKDKTTTQPAKPEVVTPSVEVTPEAPSSGVSR